MSERHGACACVSPESHLVTQVPREAHLTAARRRYHVSPVAGRNLVVVQHRLAFVRYQGRRWCTDVRRRPYHVICGNETHELRNGFSRRRLFLDASRFTRRSKKRTVGTRHLAIPVRLLAAHRGALLQLGSKSMRKASMGIFSTTPLPTFAHLAREPIAIVHRTECRWFSCGCF